MTVKKSLEMSKDVNKPEQLITEHIDIWTSSILAKSTSGRGSSKKYELYGITKLRELILELAVRGKIVPQDANDESASVLLERIAVEKAKLEEDGTIKKTKSVHKITDEEKPFNLPIGWKWARLSDISHYQVGKTPSTKNPSYWTESDKGIPWVSISDLNHFGTVKTTSKKITPLASESVFKTVPVRAGTILMSFKLTLGKISILEEDAYHNEAIISLYPFSGVSKEYLFRTLPKRALSGNSKQAIMGNTLNSKSLSLLLVPLPSLAEQKRIVAKVDKLMMLCDQLEQQTEASIDAHATLVEVLLATLIDSTDSDELAQNWARISEHFNSLFTTEQSIEALKQTVLQLAVMGKLVPQNPNEEPASVLLERINEVKYKLVKEEGLRTSASKELNADDKYLTQPHGWEWMRLGNLAKFIDYRGKTPTKIESGVRLITAKNIRYGYVDLKPEEFISEDEYTSWMTRGFPKQGDTLFTPEAPLGNAANIDIKGKFALAQRAICFQWHLSGISDFLLLQILAQPFQLQLIDNATGMTATGIKASKLKEIPMIIPPLAEQQRIVTKVNELIAICDQLKVKLQQSKETQVQLTNSLIDRALG